MELTDAPQPYIRPSKVAHEIKDESESETTTFIGYTDLNDKDSEALLASRGSRRSNDDRSEIYQLWLESRKEKDGSLRALGHVRPLNWANLKVGLKVLPYSARLFSRALKELPSARLCLMIFSKATQGISELQDRTIFDRSSKPITVPAWKGLALANLLDCVSILEKPVTSIDHILCRFKMLPRVIPSNARG